MGMQDNRLVNAYEQLHLIIDEWQGYITEVNQANGWFEKERPFSADIALLHSEVSEAYEAARKNLWHGQKDSVQDELADIFIRLLDTAQRTNTNLAWQVMKKVQYNAQRSYRHGGKVE